MVDGLPDRDRFFQVVGALVHREAGEPAVRAYGEMVDLLWRDGLMDAAIRLEELWNELGRGQAFSLLCAYVMGDFYKETQGDRFREMCRTHTHVRPTEAYARIAEPEDRLREVALLQQRARELESEIERRKQLEAELRLALQERRRAEAARDEFLAMLGHELRNPLSPIVTALQLMKLRASKVAVREREIIERQVEHLVRLVDDLLDVSRITRGK